MQATRLILLTLVIVYASSCCPRAYASNGIGSLSDSQAEVVFFDQKSVTISLEFRANLQSNKRIDLPTILYFFEGDLGFYGVDDRDPDWKLLTTNNATSWIWSLHKQHVHLWTATPPLWAGLWYPCETFTLRLWIATNSPAFNLTARFSGYGYELGRRILPVTDTEEIPMEVRSEFSKSYVPNRYSVELVVRHTPDYELFILFFAVFILWIWAILIELVRKRSKLKSSDFIQVCLGVLFFVPVFLLTFRTTIAPNYLTWVDFSLGVLAIVWGIILFWRIKSYNRI